MNDSPWRPKPRKALCKNIFCIMNENNICTAAENMDLQCSSYAMTKGLCEKKRKAERLLTDIHNCVANVSMFKLLREDIIRLLD